MVTRVAGRSATTAPARSGPLGRLGGHAAEHARLVFVLWAVVAVGLGVLAPKVEHALSGAGWEASGSESVQVRSLVDERFGGQSSSALWVVVHATGHELGDPEFAATVARVTAVLDASPHVTQVVPPQPGVSVSADRRTALVLAGAADSPTEMVAAVDDLKGELAAAGRDGVTVSVTGSSAMWSDFNTANREAMVKSELLSWPVTLVILVVAFGSLVAAGLPLMLTVLGLVAAAGSLVIASEFFDISIWAMNFALMFALALGIDYALFVVHRFRKALVAGGRSPREAVEEAMDTAGKAVLFSGVTVLISLSAVMLVPSPAFRSMAFGIMLSVVFVLVATLTLLPAVLSRLGPRVDRLGLPWLRRSERGDGARFGAWARLLWRRPVRFGLAALAVLVALALPVLGLKTAMPSIAVVPEGDQSRTGYEQVQAAFGVGAPGTLQVVVPASDAPRALAVLRADGGIARALPAARSGDAALLQAVPADGPSSEAVGATIDRLRADLPATALVGGAVAENHDLEKALSARTPLVIGIVLALGFLLLLVALQAPVAAALGVLTNLLATGAAFGVAKLVFQDGHGSGLLGFESQGYLDAWGPVFFFAMIFAVAMDYTVFLLASAKEHVERSGDPKDAVVGGLSDAGGVIFAAAGVMVAVFFTFALSGPLPPKEMGVILGVAVLLDALLVRLVLVPVLLRVLAPVAWVRPRWMRVLPSVSFAHERS